MGEGLNGASKCILCTSGIFLSEDEAMANYDTSIRIDTKINTKSAIVQLERLENRMEKTYDTIISLRSKLDSLKDAKMPTQEYKEVQNQIDVTE